MTLAIAATLDFPGAQPQYKMVDVTVDTAAPELVGDPQISTGEKGERLLTLERVEKVRHAQRRCSGQRCIVSVFVGLSHFLPVSPQVAQGQTGEMCRSPLTFSFYACRI